MTVEGGIFLFLGLLFILPALYWLSRLVNRVAGEEVDPALAAGRAERSCACRRIALPGRRRNHHAGQSRG